MADEAHRGNVVVVLVTLALASLLLARDLRSVFAALLEEDENVELTQALVHPLDVLEERQDHLVCQASEASLYSIILIKK